MFHIFKVQPINHADVESVSIVVYGTETFDKDGPCILSLWLCVVQ